MNEIPASVLLAGVGVAAIFIGSVFRSESGESYRGDAARSGLKKLSNIAFAFGALHFAPLLIKLWTVAVFGGK